MSYTYDIQTTPGPWAPDATPFRGMGVGISSHVWIRVTRGDQSTAWTECLGCPWIYKARTLFDAALATYGDVGEDVAKAFRCVTGVEMVLS